MAPLSLVPPLPPPRSPLRAIAVAAFATFALGTTFYALGVTAWSGRRVASFDVQQGESVPLPALAGLHAGSRAQRIGPVHLDRAMSPARVLAHVGYQPQAGRALTCQVTLRGPDGRTVWSEDRGFGAPGVGLPGQRGAETTLLIRTFAVPRDGDYTLAVDFGAGASGAIQGVRLEVRRQVASVQAWFVVLGAMLALASLAAVLFAGPRPALLRSRRARAA
jgi:hypothetical protein